MPRLDDIRARLAAATPGPWKHGEKPHSAIHYVWSGFYSVAQDVLRNDADLIANAPTDLAALTGALDAIDNDLKERARILRTTADRLNEEVRTRHPDRDPDSAIRYHSYASEAEQVYGLVRKIIHERLEGPQ